MRRAALLLCVLGACTSEAERRYAEARELDLAGNVPAAVAEYRALAARLEGKEGKDAELRAESLVRAGDLCYLQLADHKCAAESYRALIALTPESEASWAAREKLADLAERHLGNLPEAIAHRAALAASGRPGADKFQYEVATGWFTLRKYDEARREADVLATRSPKGELADDALLLKANCYQVEGKHEQAIPVLEEIVRRWPDTEQAARALLQLGQSRLATGDLERGLQDMLESLKLHPDPHRVQGDITRARRLLAVAKEQEQKDALQR